MERAASSSGREASGPRTRSEKRAKASTAPHATGGSVRCGPPRATMIRVLHSARAGRPPSRFAYLDHPAPIAFAHRGGAGDWPENTMPAFAAAVALGYRYLETDAHATADGVLLAFHDDRLDRVTDRTGRIVDLPYRDVAEARVGG